MPLVGLISGGLLGGSDGKEFACSAGDLGLMPGSGRSPGEGNGNPLQYSCPWEIPWTEEPWGSWRVGGFFKFSGSFLLQ